MTKDKKNSRPGAPTLGRPDGSGACEVSSDPIIQSTTSMSPGQGLHIADLLSHGADHGLHLSDLVRLTDLSERDVRRQIEIERRSGALIISDNRNGYYLTDDPGEAKQFARSMRHRADQIKQTATAIEQAIGRAKEAAGI